MTRTLILAAALSATQAAAQSRHGDRPVMARDAEIALARTAAPAAISAKARVWIWNGTKYVVGDSGSTSVNCYVARQWLPSVEPHCLDEEASRTILPIMMRRIELFAQKKTDKEVDAEINDGIAKKRFALPTRPAMTYMMSAAQDLVSGNGAAVGAWQPHLMIYFPNLTEQGVGLQGFVQGVGFVENPGTPLSALIIPLKAFVPVAK